jgi:hypothetical protein
MRVRRPGPQGAVGLAVNGVDLGGGHLERGVGLSVDVAGVEDVADGGGFADLETLGRRILGPGDDRGSSRARLRNSRNPRPATGGFEVFVDFGTNPERIAGGDRRSRCGRLRGRAGIDGGIEAQHGVAHNGKRVEPATRRAPSRSTSSPPTCQRANSRTDSTRLSVDQGRECLNMESRLSRAAEIAAQAQGHTGTS